MCAPWRCMWPTAWETAQQLLCVHHTKSMRVAKGWLARPSTKRRVPVATTAAAPLPFGGIDLHLSSALHAPDPTNIVNVVLKGLPPSAGQRSPIMPAFGSVIADAQVVDLLTYMRAAFTDKPTWPGLPALVAKQREKAGTLPMYPSDGELSAPARPNEGVTSW